MATYTNNGGTLEFSGTDITSAYIYAALISEAIGTGHVEDTSGAIDVYVFNAPIRIMAGAIWDCSNQIVKIVNPSFQIYGSVVSGDESGGTSVGGGGFIHIGSVAEGFRLFDGGSFKMYGGYLYATHRIRVDGDTDFWAIDCDGQLLDSVSAGENSAYGSNQDVRYDRSRLHDSTGVGVKLYSFGNATFSLSQTKVENCLYAFQVGDPAFLAPVLFDVEIDSCDFHVVGNKGDIDITFVNPDFTVYRPSTIGLTVGDVARVAFRYELNVLDAANAPIEGAAVVIRDGASEVQSSGTTDINGNVSGLPSYDGQTVLFNSTNAGSVRTDRANTTRSICKYGYLIRQDAFTVDADFVDNANLIVNQQITLSEAAAAALTEVSTPAQAIAAINKYIQDNYDEESDLPAFIDDGGLNCRDNTVVFDATAAQVVAYSGGTLTLKAMLFEGLVITTSTVSTVNGAAQTGGVISADGDSFLSFQAVDSWVAYSSESDQDANANALASGTSSDIYQFTYSGGTTYYLRLIVSGRKIFDAVTPAAPGETPIDLGNAAQLTVINASIQESSSFARYGGRITVNLIDGIDSTANGVGTPEAPTLSVANALVLADSKGLKTIEVQGASTAMPQTVNGYRFIAGLSNSAGARLFPTISLTTTNGADNCEFEEFEVTGATDVSAPVFGNRFVKCLLNDLDGATGVATDCKLAGDISVTYALEVVGNSYGTVNFNVVGANARLNLPSFSGSLTLSNMASPTAQANIGVVAGAVTVDASCENCLIIIANADQVTNNSSTATVIVLQDTSGGGGGGVADWTDAERAQIRQALGVDGSKTLATGGLLQTLLPASAYVVPPTVQQIDDQLSATHGAGSWTGSGGSGGDDAATIYAYFTDGVRADAFKATGFSTFDPLTTSVTVSAIENNVITSSTIANNAFTNSAFTTGYYNTINSELDTALADYDAPTKAELDAGLAALQTHGDTTWQTATGFSTFNPATDTVARVALVDVCTENADMRGTDGANTVAPDNATINSISATVELLRKYHDNESVFLAADQSTKTTQSLAYYTVVYDDDGVTPLKTVMFTNSAGSATPLPNATGYEKL